jgi:hypothetical protein
MADRPKKGTIGRLIIPWDSMRETYNKDHGTAFPSVRDWLEALLKKHGRVLKWASDELGVSPPALVAIMEITGLRNPPPIIKKKTPEQRLREISRGEMKEMTFVDILSRSQCSESKIYRFLLETGWDYKRKGPIPANSKRKRK